jgi:hypothetical protein
MADRPVPKRTSVFAPAANPRQQTLQEGPHQRKPPFVEGSTRVIGPLRLQMDDNYHSPQLLLPRRGKGLTPVQPLWRPGCYMYRLWPSY